MAGSRPAAGPARRAGQRSPSSERTRRSAPSLHPGCRAAGAECTPCRWAVRQAVCAVRNSTSASACPVCQTMAGQGDQPHPNTSQQLSDSQPLLRCRIVEIGAHQEKYATGSDVIIGHDRSWFFNHVRRSSGLRPAPGPRAPLHGSSAARIIFATAVPAVRKRSREDFPRRVPPRKARGFRHGATARSRQRAWAFHPSRIRRGENPAAPRSPPGAWCRQAGPWSSE